MDFFQFCAKSQSPMGDNETGVWTEVIKKSRTPFSSSESGWNTTAKCEHNFDDDIEVIQRYFSASVDIT